MTELAFWPRLLLAVFATWRVTHLLAHEDGPGDALVRVRRRLASGKLAGLVDCFNCLSLWVALPLSAFVARAPMDALLAWLALSGAACLLERLGGQPVVIQQLPGFGEPDSPARGD